MRLLFIILGGVFSAIFILLILKGKKYDYMLDALDSNDFPLKSIYVVGLAFQDNEKLMRSIPVFDKLKADTKLLYSKKYEEYYARIIFAQIFSFALLSLAMGFSIAAAFGGTFGIFFAVLGIICCVLSSWYFYNYTSSKIKSRQDVCDTEFPDAISKLALIVNSGVILRDAWKIVAEGNDGEFYELMKSSCSEMENGVSEVEAIRYFGVLTNSDEIKKFTTALIQSIERGGGELPLFLANQSGELWKIKKQHMLQKGETAASKLLIPVALMFAGIMLIVLASALQSMNF